MIVSFQALDLPSARAALAARGRLRHTLRHYRGPAWSQALLTSLPHPDGGCR